jgi:OOP family OmpA-OmpF porin
MDLSKKRAAAVAKALVKRGVAAGRLNPQGLGPCAPVASNDNDAGRAKNRRVELVKE